MTVFVVQRKRDNYLSAQPVPGFILIFSSQKLSIVTELTLLRRLARLKISLFSGVPLN